MIDDGKIDMNKKTGIVNFSMTVNQSHEVREVSYETPGLLYFKNGKYYLFFDEHNIEDDSITKCRMEFSLAKLRLRREGVSIIEQIYNQEERTQGYIKTIYGELRTEAQTLSYVLEEKDIIQILLDYNLSIEGEDAGQYKLKIQFIKEDI